MASSIQPLPPAPGIVADEAPTRSLTARQLASLSSLTRTAGVASVVLANSNIQKQKQEQYEEAASPTSMKIRKIPTILAPGT